jgi:hypothetical protein
MNKKRLTLEGQLEDYEGKLKGLRSYIKELTERTKESGTDSEQFETDLMEAQHNIKYYEGEIALIKEELAEEDKTTGTPDEPTTVLQQILKPDIGTLILASVSFVAGAILASQLSSRSGSKDSRGGE